MIFKRPPKDFKPKFEIAFCISGHDGKLLLLQRQDNKGQAGEWGVPAGKLENNETAKKAAKRELFEETGLIIPESKFMYITKLYDRYPTFDFTMNIFHVSLEKKEDIILNDTEHKDFRWVTLDEALKMKLMQDVDVCLKLYSKN